MSLKLSTQRIRNLSYSSRDFLLTLSSLTAILLILLNLAFIHSFGIGVVASLAYFVVNGIFLARVFFEREDFFSRALLAGLTLITFLGLISWAVMIVYNLDIVRSAIALTITALSSSFAKRLAPGHSKGTPAKTDITVTVRDMKSFNAAKEPSPFVRSHLAMLFFLFAAGLSFYLLIISRIGEVQTVWQAVHPMFMYTFFVATILLIIVVFSSEKTHFKLLSIILHSVLSHTFFVVIFPAGNWGPQESILTVSRRIFDSTLFDGWGGATAGSNIIMRLYNSTRGTNFQSALSVMFARVFSVDVFWSHLPLVPLLWGIFVPVIAYLITRTIGGSERVSVLSSLLVSVFPLLINWGAVSIPESLSFMLFFCSLYFILRFFTTQRFKDFVLMILFMFTSFLAHYLGGIMSFAFLVLGLAIRKYENEKVRSPLTSRSLLLISFILCTTLLPFALTYHRIFSPLYAYFSLDKIQGLSTTDLIGLFLFGEYINYYALTALIHIAGPLLGLIGMLYSVRLSSGQRSNKKYRFYTFFLILGFLMVWLDYRIFKLLMVMGPTIEEERMWVFRDFIAVPFTAFLIDGIVSYLRKQTTRLSSVRTSIPSLLSSFIQVKKSLKPFLPYLLGLCLIVFPVLLAGLTTVSIYAAYPHFGPLQTTSYELEAVKYIDSTTTGRYVVIGDSWINTAGLMFVGLGNSRAIYLYSADPHGLILFVQMRTDPSPDILIEAMKSHDAATGYFIIQKPRLGTQEYNRIVQQAHNNSLQTYSGGIFYYQGEEKLRIFYYEKG